MTKNYKRHTVTAALPYANGGLHIGHMAGVYVPADIYVRYLRMKGEDVMFVCGSDEHGVPVTIRAEKEGITVQEVVDKYHNLIKKSFEEFGISFDIYHRTSDAVHQETAQSIFKDLHNKNIFIEKETEQYYDEEKKRFLADRYIQGTCPKCGNPDAYGDQCEKCGSTLSPDELINPRSALSNTQPVRKKTSHYYLPLDQYENWLKEWILEGHKEDWRANVYGQCKSWIDEGLKPRAITRDLDWGVKVPLENAEGKVLYVWFDAPIGYISATKAYFADKAKSDNAVNAEDWKKYWQDENTKLVHFIGKDNIVFHCIIFPTILKAQGEFILPDNVPANEFLNLENDKISTSRNWAVWLHEYNEEFAGQSDILRYYLTAIAPEAKDNNFTWQGFLEKNNSELADTFGNFVRRPIALTHNYFGGKVPKLNKLEEIDQKLIEELKNIKDKISNSIENYRFREAQSFLMDLARLGNQYMQETSPWLLYKEDKEGNLPRIETILHLGLQIIANLAILSEPFLPNTAKTLKETLNLENLSWQEASRIDILEVGKEINKATILFKKLEQKDIAKQVEKLEKIKAEKEAEAKKAESQNRPVKPEITFEDFQKLDIRVATITNAEKIKKADKLLKITLDTGIGERTVVSGIAQHYKPEDIIGQQVSVILNLAPRKMRGVMSEGMILMAEDSEGNLKFVSPTEKVDEGSEVR